MQVRAAAAAAAAAQRDFNQDSWLQAKKELRISSGWAWADSCIKIAQRKPISSRL